MRQFTDKNGRAWQVVVNVATIKRVKDLLKIDLLGDENAIKTLLVDIMVLVDVVFVVVKPQADAAGVTDLQFAEAMGGDSLDGATVALLEELTDFFPSARRAAIKSLVARFRGLEEEVMRRVTKRIDDPAVTEAVMRDLETLGATSTASPASSESTPPR